MFLHLQLQGLQWEWEEMDIQLLSNFSYHISKPMLSHLHVLACSNHTATKSLPSRAWDLTLVNAKEVYTGPQAMKSFEFFHTILESVCMFTMRHVQPPLPLTAMAPWTCIHHRQVAHCALCSCSHLLLPIDGAPKTRAGQPFLNSQSLAFY